MTGVQTCALPISDPALERVEHLWPRRADTHALAARGLPVAVTVRDKSNMAVDSGKNLVCSRKPSRKRSTSWSTSIHSKNNGMVRTSEPLEFQQGRWWCQRCRILRTGCPPVGVRVRCRCGRYLTRTSSRADEEGVVCADSIRLCCE